MRIRMIISAALAAIFLAPAVIATTREAEAVSIPVRAKGSGDTEDAALQQAYRNAVEKAVKIYTDANQEAEGDELKVDEILTQANAYVERYDVVSRKEEDGLVTLTIKAVVGKRELAKHGQSVEKKPETVSEQLSSIHAKTTSLKVKGDDGAALLAKTLSDLDPASLLEASLASQTGVQRVRQLPADVRASENTENELVLMDYLLKLTINKKRYYDEFLPPLVEILDQVSTTTPRETILGVRNVPVYGDEENRFKASPEGRYGQNRLCGRHWIDAGDGGSRKMSKRERNASRQPSDNRQERTVIVVTKSNDSMTSVKGRVYTLDEECSKVYGDWISRVNQDLSRNPATTSESGLKRRDLTARGPACIVDFLGADGGEILSFAVDSAAPRTLMGIGEKHVTPFLGVEGCELYCWRCFRIPKKDLPLIKSIKVRFDN